MVRPLLAAAVLALSAPAIAGLPEDRAYLAKLQAEDLRLQTLGWRLATANAAFCEARPAIGLLLQDMASYAAPARMRAAAGIAGDIGVGAAVPGSPAAQAGLAADDEVLAIDGNRMADLPAAKAGSWQRLAALHDAIDGALLRSGAVRVAWRDARGGEHDAIIAGTPACPTRFELLDSGTRASADGKRVVMGRDFAGFGYAEDELAAVLAHELAHNLLAHRAWLRSVGRMQGNIRVSEREADRLMPWLLANAGYDPGAALRFMTRWGPRHDGGLFRNRNHEGWDERADAIAAEIEGMKPHASADGRADWKTHFVRETGR